MSAPMTPPRGARPPRGSRKAAKPDFPESTVSHLLELDAVEVVYDGVIAALHGVSLAVPRGAIVALLGANGAGKTTTLKAASRLLATERGEVVAGTVRFDGEDVGALRANRLVERGLSQVLEGRRCFAQLSVEENLMLGGFVRRPSVAELSRSLEQVYTRFPRLKQRRQSPAGVTSGGEQQMLAIGRALMASPKLLLLDEPSMGLAPIVVQEIFDGITALNRDDGVSFLLAEQNATVALRVAHRGVVLENGRVAASGTAAELLARDDIKRFYLGEGDFARRSYIDAHHLRPANFHSSQALRANP